MDDVTKKVASYVESLGVNIAKMSRDIGVPYRALYDSLVNNERNRTLRDREFLLICQYLEKNPMDFADHLPRKAI